MYRNLGWDRATCAKNLHVTLRTLHNWESGRHDIPYSAYRLLRLLGRMELPGESWTGWCFVGGVLYTPEGRPITGKDGSWWSLLIRQAAMFGESYRARHRGPDAARAARGLPACGGTLAGGEASSTPAPAGGRREAPAPNLLIVHFGTQPHVFGANTGAYAINPVAKTAYSLVAANKTTVKGVA